MLRVGLIGAGLIGSKRAKTVADHPETVLSWVCDVNPDRARQLAESHGCRWSTNWEELVASSELDVVIIAVINKYLLPICVAALNDGKHVLAEKPLGRSSREAHQMAATVHVHHVHLKVGFNHRYHPAYQQLVNLYQENAIGELLYIRACYGHGGRPGYDKEWRADLDLAGGGELLDQGIHIIDLARNLMGEFIEAFGYADTCFWDMKPLEDNAFVLLKNAGGQTLSLHASWTQWKNLFRFEVFGNKGYLIIEGLGGSYGVETLRFGKRKPESGPPEEQVFLFNGPDRSWELEWQEFVQAILTGSPYQATGQDGYEVMKVVDAIYESSRTGKKVEIR